MKSISDIELKKLLKKEFARGAIKAAEIARNYNSTSNHDNDLGDSILLKLNLITKEKVRKNDKQLTQK